MRSQHRVIGLALSLLILASCARTDDRDESTPSREPSTATVTKLLVVVVENHSLDEMSAAMPYTFGLAQMYGYATHFTALTHPSLPNYLAIVGGRTFGVTDDAAPASHRVTGPSVFGQAVALGKTATVYAEGMPEPCALRDGGHRYAVRHNPWTYFVDERDLCAHHDVALDALDASTLR